MTVLREVVARPEFENVRFRLDCHSCLLVEIGERANYLGLPCETCGRKPRFEVSSNNK